jgi:hypothetical protein
MAVAALVVSIVATVAAVAAVAIALGQAKVARRDLQLELDKYRDSRLAFISVEPSTPEVVDADVVSFGFELTNVGKAHARHLRGRLEDQSGDVISRPARPTRPIRPIAPDSGVHLELSVPSERLSRVHRAWLVLEWDDQFDQLGVDLAPNGRRVGVAIPHFLRTELANQGGE